MKVSGYLSRKTVGNKTYIYLRRSVRQGKQVSHRYLFAFGPMPAAVEKMYWLRENPEQFPVELIELGFNLNDLDEWILTIETEVTSTGRHFILNNHKKQGG